MRLLLALVVAAWAAAPADAQTLALDVGSFGAPLLPLSGYREVSANVTAPCLRSPEGAPVGVRLAVNGPLVGSAKAAPAEVTPDTPCEGTFTANFTVLLAFEPTARALEAYVFTVHATAANATTNATANASLAAVPAYFSILDAQARETIRLVPPGGIATYPVTIANFGNGITKAFFEVTTNAEGFSVAVPNPVTLEPGQNATIPLAVLAPSSNGYANEVGATTFRITSHFALDPRLKGDETAVSVLTTVRGWHLPASGLVPLAAILSLAAVAWRRVHR